MTQEFDHDQPLVSIIMPAYNCESFIQDALDSVIAQTYPVWEVIVVDDCSTDNTAQVVKVYARQDSRIRYMSLETHSGTAISRNKGIALAGGKYLAFLDSDDIWFPQKLERQLRFMQQNGYTFTCTAYKKIDEKGSDLNIIIPVLPESDYKTLLKTSAGNSTVIYNAEVLGKFTIPDIKKRNDYVMWLQVIKKAKKLYGLNEPLGCHRIRTGSLSKNKFSLISYHWVVYREIEHLSLIRSVYLILYWCIKTILKFVIK